MKGTKNRHFSSIVSDQKSWKNWQKKDFLGIGSHQKNWTVWYFSGIVSDQKSWKKDFLRIASNKKSKKKIKSEIVSE